MGRKDSLLETKRLVLRRFDLLDIEDFSEIFSDAETLIHEPYGPFSGDELIEKLEELSENDSCYAVILKENGKLIGSVFCGCMDRETGSWEIGFVFNRRFWRRGFAKEASEATIRTAAVKGARRIYAECSPENPASWHLLEALGFRRETLLSRNKLFRKNGARERRDTLIYSRTVTENIPGAGSAYASAVSHIALYAEDPVSVAAFWTEDLGAAGGETYHNPKTGLTSIFLALPGGGRVEVMHDGRHGKRTENVTGYHHIAVSLGSEKAVDDLTESLRDRGVRVVSGPRRTGDGYYESVIEDPEGNRIELTV